MHQHFASYDRRDINALRALQDDQNDELPIESESESDDDNFYMDLDLSATLHADNSPLSQADKAQITARIFEFVYVAGSASTPLHERERAARFVRASVSQAIELASRHRYYDPPALLSAADSMGWTLLHYATFYSDIQLAHLLLSGGAPVDAIDKTGNTPLHWAVQHRNEQIMYHLLQYGANPRQKNILSVSPLKLAPPHLRVILLAPRDILCITDGREIPRMSWIKQQARQLTNLIRAFLANQIIQLILQLLLVLLVEVFQEQFKRTAQFYLLIFFRLWTHNLIMPIVTFLFPAQFFGPIFAALNTYITPVLYKVVYHITYILYLVLSPFVLGIYDFLLAPILQVLWMIAVPIAQFIYRTLLAKLTVPFWHLISVIFKAIAPHLQQRAVLKRLAYPFVTGFSKIQKYLLPQWLLLRYEALISRSFGHSTQKEVDIALVIVFSFLAIMEGIVIVMGYIFKLCQLISLWWVFNMSFGFDYVPAIFLSYGDRVDSWWPNLNHHELGALLLMLVMFVTSVIAFAYGMGWALQKTARRLWRKFVKPHHD